MNRKNILTLMFALTAIAAIGVTVLISDCDSSNAGADWENTDYWTTHDYSGSVGTAFYVVTDVHNSSGDPQLDFSIHHTTGSLPPGLTYSNHIISGTPTTSGTYQYTVFGGLLGTTYTITYNITISGAQFWYMYYVTENSSNVFNMPNTQTVNRGSATAVSSEIPVWYGYQFCGWKWGNASSIVQPGEGVTPTCDVTLTAQWVVATNLFAIYYNGNGGYAVPSNTTIYSSNSTVSAQVTTQKPTRDGYTFTGWSENRYAETPTYVSGQTITLSGTIQLYAVWTQTATPKTITFNVNGGTGSIPAQTVVPGNSITLPISGVSKTGCILVAWNLNSNIGPIYSPGQTYTVTDNVTFYAQYSPLDGNLDPDAPTTCNINQTYSYTPVFSSTSVWRMWSEARYSDFAPTIDEKPAWMTVTNLTSKTQPPTFSGIPSAPGIFVVKTHVIHSSASVVSYSTITWTITVADPNAGTHTLVYDSNEGSGSIASVSAQHNNAIELESSGMTRAGYRLGGWWIDERGTEVVYPLGSMLTIVKNVTARACWVPEANIVIFDANGGTMDNGSTFSAYLSTTDSVVTLQSSGISKAGYIHAGWYKSTNSNEIYAPDYLYTTTATTTFVAYWISVNSSTKVTVKIDANGGTGGYSQMIETSKRLVLPVIGILKTGSTLNGFNAGSTSGTSYAPGTAVTISSAITFYASWSSNGGGGGGTNPPTPTTITVTFNANGGTGSYPIQTITAGSKAIKPTDPTRPGYLFIGWRVSGGASNFNFATALTTDTVLEAQWQTFFTVTTSGRTVTVTQAAHIGVSTTVSWWDGTTTTSTSGTFTHTFTEDGSGTLTVTANLGDTPVSSSMYVTVSSSGGGTPGSVTYTVTWVVDGRRTTVTLNEGDTPIYGGGTPTKPGYEFKRWTPAIVPVANNTTYTAVFEPINTADIDWTTLIALIVATVVGIGILYLYYPVVVVPFGVVMAIIITRTII